MEKTKQLAQGLNVKDFESNNGVLERWKEMNNIKFKKYNYDKQDPYYFGAESWIRDAPPAVIKDYEAKDILHADETELDSRAIRDGTLSFKNSERAACKIAIEQGTLYLHATWTGVRSLSHLILETAKTHCVSRS
ncbi:Tigger transposable element-derived protein 4 [Thelohanellus kitauei]|uniref:Tigger transposable element-derived protein 4 n=1 Tax=Thelohanellus kitauei TaxID=669202 RepID=A0A0C2IZC9_THEKT|nr:Tigger transposable element-derived protein 4 [Thelohanellus kitauei]KII73396.1 Tigger transposable element-derived protein 4 [Thelohanellus kitauei]